MVRPPDSWRFSLSAFPIPENPTPTPSAGVRISGRFAFDPALKEHADDPVPRPEPTHAITDRVDHARAVRDRDQRQAEFGIVAPLDDQQVAVVERCGSYPHAHLTRTGSRHRPFR